MNDVQDLEDIMEGHVDEEQHYDASDDEIAPPQQVDRAMPQLRAQCLRLHRLYLTCPTRALTEHRLPISDRGLPQDPRSC